MYDFTFSKAFQWAMLGVFGRLDLAPKPHVWQVVLNVLSVSLQLSFSANKITAVSYLTTNFRLWQQEVDTDNTTSTVTSLEICQHFAVIK